MNKIKALKYSARKEQYELQDVTILNYSIDDIWLDEALEQKFPNQRINELIPSLLHRFNDEEVIKCITDNFVPKLNGTSICPVLTCNQGCGLDCTAVFAAIENKGDIIIWRKLGLKTTGLNNEIQWLDGFSDLKFTYQDYNNLLQDFKKFRTKL